MDGQGFASRPAIKGEERQNNGGGLDRLAAARKVSLPPQGSRGGLAIGRTACFHRGPASTLSPWRLEKPGIGMAPFKHSSACAWGCGDGAGGPVRRTRSCPRRNRRWAVAL